MERHRRRAEVCPQVIETSQIVTEAGMVDLGIGQPQLELLPHDLLREAAQSRLTGDRNACLNYGPARGDGYLRLGLAELLSARYGCPVPPESLMMTGGASQALQMLAATLARPGQTVLVEEPTYFLAHQIFADCGLKVVGVPLGQQGLEPETLREAIAQHRPALLYMIPVHQNPSGLTLAAEHRRPIVDLCAGNGVVLLADEVYQMLTYEGQPPAPMAAQIDSGCVVSVGSFSKILAPGLRLGWIQASQPLLARLTSLGVFASGGGLNHFTGCLVQEVLAAGQQAVYLDRLRCIYGHRVDLLDRLLREHLGDLVEYRKPQGGYFFWLRLSDGRDAARLLATAGEQKVGYRAGARFSTRGDFADHLRLSFAHYGDEDLERGVERLARVLHGS